MSKASKILVSGCAGFIGSHLCERLLSDGYHVIGIDNFDPFYPRDVKENNLSHFVNNKDFTFAEIDICDSNGLSSLDLDGVDLIAHIAAKAGVRPSIIDPQSYIDVNLQGTNNILELMVKKKIEKLFFASSSSIYGNQKEIPFKEKEIDYQPISPYAFTKRSCELMNYTYHHLHKLDIINARFFTVYGPRQRPDLAIHKFVKLIDEGRSIPMFGDGSTARDYTYISDTIDGIMGSIKHLQKNVNVFETYNLGNNSPVVLRDMIEIIANVLGKKVKIDNLPMQEGDVDITYADINKAYRLIRYKPKVKIEEGVAKFVKWYKDQKKIEA
ncbi:MAG: NAD-dependent epimerase/dehydratase family protein [Bacteroidia bacterium]|nr:NAD-dependent epimerase/dehydratase family protein [Bacteroidia bacterium]